jgi:hypothetical protein
MSKVWREIIKLAKPKIGKAKHSPPEAFRGAVRTSSTRRGTLTGVRPAQPAAQMA